MIHKTHMTIDAYLRQAGIKPTNSDKPTRVDPLIRNSDSPFYRALVSAASATIQGTGAATHGATIADYLNQRLTAPASLGFNRTAIHSGAFNRFVPDRNIGATEVSRPDSLATTTAADHEDMRTKAAPAPETDIDVSIAGSIRAAAKKYDLSEKLVESVIRAESNFKPDAVSPAGAQGLMQLMPATARELGVEDPFDVHQNIDGGARYIRQMLDRFGGDLKLALAAYNAGPGAVERHNGNVPYRETRAYVRRVLAGIESKDVSTT